MSDLPRKQNKTKQKFNEIIEAEIPTYKHSDSDSPNLLSRESSSERWHEGERDTSVSILGGKKTYLNVLQCACSLGAFTVKPQGIRHLNTGVKQRREIKMSSDVLCTEVET